MRWPTDSEKAWNARGGLAIDGFDYALLNNTQTADVHWRLDRLEQVMPDYAPGPYDRSPAAYRRVGPDDRAEPVLVARRIRHHAGAGAAGRIWGGRQRHTVGFSYRPWLAACWPVLSWLAGAIWFLGNVQGPVDDGQHPVFNAWTFSADTLLSAVNVGQDGFSRLHGASQWIGSALVVAGRILATTAAVGAARISKRVS